MVDSNTPPPCLSLNPAQICLAVLNAGGGGAYEDLGLLLCFPKSLQQSAQKFGMFGVVYGRRQRVEPRTSLSSKVWWFQSSKCSSVLGGKSNSKSRNVSLSVTQVFRPEQTGSGMDVCVAVVVDVGSAPSPGKMCIIAGL